MKCFFFLVLMQIAWLSGAQTIDTAWTLSIGGTGTEMNGQTMLNNVGGYRAKLSASTDGTFYLASYSASTDGIMYSNAGNDDMLLVKLNADGDTLWSRRYGGAESERAFNVLALGDSGCVVVGYSISTDGVFAANHAAGYGDGVVIRVDENGNTVWLKMFGGENLDYLYDIILTSDGALMACGETASNTGDLSGTGAGLNWVIKMNLSDGSKIWSKAYEGPFAASPDMLENITELTELSGGNGVILSGFGSPDWADFNLDDIIYMKIDLNGNLQWVKSIGSGTGGDYSAAILDAGSGEFYIAGRLQGTGSSVTNYYGGGGDFWLIRFDATGAKLWDRNYGGTDYDFALDAAIDAHGDVYLTGFTRSTNNEATHGAQGLMDFFLLKVDAAGDTLFTGRFGGSDIDAATGICLLNNNSLVLAGRCESSNSGFVNDHIGGRDIWLVKVDSIQTSVGLATTEEHKPISLYPNPATNGQLNVRFAGEGMARVSIFNAQGQQVFEKQVGSGEVLSTGLPAGCYHVIVERPDGIFDTLKWIIL